MGAKEHVEAVRAYLLHAGCDSVDRIFLGIGGIGAGASKAGVRAALKTLEAHGRKTGGWRMTAAETDAAIKRLSEATGKDYFHFARGLADRHLPGVETLYSLRYWGQAW